MRIKPWVITMAAAVSAATAVAVIVSSTGPAEADTRQFFFLWASLGAGLWAALATVLLWSRMNVAQAVWMSAILAIAAFAAFFLVRAGIRDPRLLGGILFVTLFLSFMLWRHFRHGRT